MLCKTIIQSPVNKLDRRSALRLFGSGVLGAALGHPLASNAAPNIIRNSAKRWARIDAYLEKARLDWNAPGLAVAIVRGGETIYSKGFGVSNVDTRRPVNADTLFNIGSTSKAFTAAGIAMLVDDKKLDWDMPVRHYLPSFQLGHGDDYASTSLRDMMSHRTGLGRHDLLWYNNKNLSREVLLAALPHLDTFAPLRSKYQYNNIMVMLAGHAAERVAGISWEDLTKTRILRPLGMHRTNTSFEEMALDTNFANGHRLHENKEQYSIPLRPEDRIGPAGAVNSCVNEMAKWMALQLGKGAIGGTRLFSVQQSNNMWEPLISTGGIPSSPELSRGFYGLGWRIDGYRGMLRVAHGGNLNGFASRVSLFPEKDIGIVAFTNLGASPLPGHVTFDVLDMILDLEPANWSARNLARRDAQSGAATTAPTFPHIVPTTPSRALSQYTGRYYHAGYGEMIIGADGQTLSASYNDMPMKLEHWHYDVFNAIPERGEDDDLRNIKFSFVGDINGQITTLSAKMEDSTPPVIFTRQTN